LRIVIKLNMFYNIIRGNLLLYPKLPLSNYYADWEDNIIGNQRNNYPLRNNL
jgi:hypothetical protein